MSSSANNGRTQYSMIDQHCKICDRWLEYTPEAIITLDILFGIDTPHGAGLCMESGFPIYVITDASHGYMCDDFQVKRPDEPSELMQIIQKIKNSEDEDE